MILCANPLQQYLSYKNEIDEAVQKTLASGSYVKGPNMQAFEEEFAEYVGVKHTVSVANGTEALRIALAAVGIGQGDEVITVAHTAVATVTAIEQTGAAAVLVDIDAHTFLMDCSKLEAALSPQTKAVIGVHLYGQALELDALKTFCKKHKLVLIEDCAQAHGATYQKHRVGSVGDLAAFSFYPTKNLGAIGDGGAVVTNNAEWANRCRLIREYGWEERYISKISGWNSRLDEVQAAILRVKLRYLDKDNSSRRYLANMYNEMLAGLPLELPQTRSGNEHVFHLYVLKTQKRDELLKYLADNQIHAGIHYPVPIHLQPAYVNKIKCAGGRNLPVTERLAKEIVSLPMYPELGKHELQRVTSCIEKFYGRKAD